MNLRPIPFLIRTFTATRRIVEYLRGCVSTSRIEVFGGVACIDNVIMTGVVLMASGRVWRSNGCARVQTSTGYLPSFAHEVSGLHAIQVLKEWTSAIDQVLVQAINVRAGNAQICHQLKIWMGGGTCTLGSAAASGPLGEICILSHLLRVDVSLNPLLIRDGLTDEECSMPHDIALYVGLAECFRAVVMPQQPR